MFAKMFSACTNILQIFFDLNLLANMVAKLSNIVGEHVKFGVWSYL